MGAAESAPSAAQETPRGAKTNLIAILGRFWSDFEVPEPEKGPKRPAFRIEKIQFPVPMELPKAYQFFKHVPPLAVGGEVAAAPTVF